MKVPNKIGRELDNGKTVKQTITSHLKSLNIKKKKTMTYDIGNSGPDLGQAQKCGGVKMVKVTLQHNCTFYKPIRAYLIVILYCFLINRH